MTNYEIPLERALFMKEVDVSAPGEFKDAFEIVGEILFNATDFGERKYYPKQQLFNEALFVSGQVMTHEMSEADLRKLYRRIGERFEKDFADLIFIMAYTLARTHGVSETKMCIFYDYLCTLYKGFSAFGQGTLIEVASPIYEGKAFPEKNLNFVPTPASELQHYESSEWKIATGDFRNFFSMKRWIAAQPDYQNKNVLFNLIKKKSSPYMYDTLDEFLFELFLDELKQWLRVEKIVEEAYNDALLQKDYKDAYPYISTLRNAGRDDLVHKVKDYFLAKNGNTQNVPFNIGTLNVNGGTTQFGNNNKIQSII